MRIFLAALLLAVSTSSIADGYEFKNGRFPDRKITILQLTQQQKQLIALYRSCRDNTFSPYIFNLTKGQRAVLLKEAGLAPRRFAIFESLHGDTGIDLEFNSFNRFDVDHIEIPHALLRSDKFVRDWEINYMGWTSNPLASATESQLASGVCSK